MANNLNAMNAREAYFRTNYYVGDNKDVVIFFFFKLQDVVRMGCTQSMNMCKEDHEYNVGQMEYIEKRYGKQFMFWSVSDEGIEFQKERLKEKNLKANLVLFLTGGDISVMAANVKKMIEGVE